MIVRKNSRMLNLLGRILFPGQAPWQQRISVLVLLWAIAAGILTGGGIVAFMVLRARQ
jgi:hypothetical protein